MAQILHMRRNVAELREIQEDRNIDTMPVVASTFSDHQPTSGFEAAVRAFCTEWLFQHEVCAHTECVAHACGAVHNREDDRVAREAFAAKNAEKIPATIDVVTIQDDTFELF
jgi:hypothetical protein